MNHFVKSVFGEEGILLLETIPFSLCRVIQPHKLTCLPFTPMSAVIFLMPYYTEISGKRNLSRYAVARDYHSYVKELSKRVLSKLSEVYPEASFSMFSDNSPIDERHAAALCGLGVMGDNGLLLTEQYGPYVFIGEVLSDLPIEVLGQREDYRTETCMHCGKCQAACPKKSVCLSALTQKKGNLTEGECDEIRSLGSLWGCDVCQEVCPYAQAPQETPIAFFKNGLVPYLNSQRLDMMGEEEFRLRAYAWRGRQIIERNIRLLYKKTE